MTPDEFIKKQKTLFDLIIKQDLPLQRAAQSTHAMQTTRIFVNGKNSSGGQIGQYDTTHPLYVNPSTTAGAATGNKSKGVAGISPIGKHGETKFKNGKPHKTAFVLSYKDLRQKLGKKTSFVNLDFSGDLKSDFSNSGTPVKVNTHEYVAGLKRQINVDKVAGLTEKYGEFAAPTSEEKKNFFKVAGQEFDLMVKQSLRA